RQRRIADVRERHHDSTHGRIAALQRPQRFRGHDHRDFRGVRNMKRIAWALLALAFVTPAVAQTGSGYPDRPVHLIVPFPAGSATDIVSRVMAQRLSVKLGQQFVVENRPGASGNLGADVVAKADPDGYTMGLITASTHGVAPALGTKLPYDPIKDFKPITVIGAAPYALVLYPGTPAKTVSELVALAKSKPGSLNYGSAG